MAREVEVIIRGGPGSGKTTALAMIYRKFREAGFDVSYEEPKASARRAFNYTVEEFQEADAQPMKVTLREELTYANSSQDSN